MKTIVITGSTRGIGYGLAKSFLAAGCNVVVSGRSREAVESGVDKLGSIFSREQIFGVACDTRKMDQVQNLWDQAFRNFGRVDVWINNAGIASPVSEAWLVDSEDIEQVIDTNLKGALYGSSVAIRGMLAQGFGAVYNMEGLGSERGRIIPGMSLYGLTKAGLRFLMIRSLKNWRANRLSPVHCNPGWSSPTLSQRRTRGIQLNLNG